MLDVGGERQRVFDQVARLAAAQLHVPREQFGGDEFFDNLPIESQSTFLAATPEDRDEVFLGWRLRVDLVPDAADERFVEQVERIEVGREHDQRLEWHLELLPALEHEMIRAALERDDPAVQ